MSYRYQGPGSWDRARTGYSPGRSASISQQYSSAHSVEPHVSTPCRPACMPRTARPRRRFRTTAGPATARAGRTRRPRRTPGSRRNHRRHRRRTPRRAPCSPPAAGPQLPLHRRPVDGEPERLPPGQIDHAPHPRTTVVRARDTAGRSHVDDVLRRLVRRRRIPLRDEHHQLFTVPAAHRSTADPPIAERPPAHLGQLPGERGEERQPGPLGHLRVRVTAHDEIAQLPVPAAEPSAQRTQLDPVGHRQTHMPRPVPAPSAHQLPPGGPDQGANVFEQFPFVHGRKVKHTPQTTTGTWSGQEEQSAARCSHTSALPGRPGAGEGRSAMSNVDTCRQFGSRSGR